MIKILFVHSSSELYGSDRSLLNILKNINKSLFEIHVILPCYGSLVEELNKIGCKVIIHDTAVLRRKNFTFLGIIFFLKKFWKSINFIKKYIKVNHIDIVDTNTSVVIVGAIAAKLCRKKSVWHIREIICNPFENKIVSFFMNRFADIIISNSKATGESLRVDKSKVKIIYNAVDIKGGIKTKNSNVKIVGMAGRINRWKGQNLFVDAAEIVLKKYPDIKFWIAGDVYSGEDYLKDYLIQYIKNKGLENSVLLLGQINDMSEFYENIDIFILPSTSPEPFGLVVIEAMRYGIPVIATNHGGPTEIIEDNKDGYLVDFKHPDQMANKILYLLEHYQTRIRLGYNGFNKSKTHFTVNSMVSQIENIYINLLV